MGGVGQEQPQAVFTVLLVCTGNICRSALAERLGRAYLAETAGEAAGLIRLVSAGTGAVVDSEMHPDSRLVLQGFGADAGDFRARQLVEHMVTDADLALTMSRSHRRDLLAMAPRALQRTFTLREAADLLVLLGDDLRCEGADLTERARALVRALADARSRRHGSEDDDVRDPIGHPLEVHQEVGEVVAETLLPLLHRLAGMVDETVEDREPAG